MHFRYPSAAPFDFIHVGAAAPHIPAALVEQLAPGGRLVIPVGPENATQVWDLGALIPPEAAPCRSCLPPLQEFMVVDKGLDGQVTKRSVMQVVYVPLTTRLHQLERR